MKIGILFCAYNAQPYLATALAPWIAARAAKLDGHEFLICAVSVPFESFPQQPTDDTRSFLGSVSHLNAIDHAIVRDKPMKETAARGAALNWLRDAGADLIWQWDSDELTDLAEISRTIRFVESKPLIPWFRGSLKNYVFDRQTYLTQPFTPPRIHRARIGDRVAAWFWDDNNIAYGNASGYVHDTALPSATIPKAIAWVSHFSWLNDQRSKLKCEYQWARWGRCDFAWDESRGGLIWRDGTTPPETERES